MDFNTLKTRLTSLLRGKDDRFLVAEILSTEEGNRVRVADIRANFADSVIKVLRIREGSDLKKILKKFGRLSKYKIILGLDSHLATTIYSSVVLVRDRFKELIDEPELDNLISQAIWKFFDRQRSKVATKMSASDLDIILTDVKIRGIRLDGHKVVNPVGFKAKTIEVQFSQTFLLRPFVESLKQTLPLEQVVLMGESGTAWSSVVAKSNISQNFMLAGILPGKTLLFAASGSQNSYWDQFAWGEQNLHRSLAVDLALGEDTAAAVVGKYIAGGTSAPFKRRLETLLSKELQSLANGLNHGLKKIEGKDIFIYPMFDLPAIFLTNFRNSFDKPANLRTLDLDIISENFGFDIKFKHKSDAKHSFGLIANLLEWYLAPEDTKMSQMAKRRVRWLSPV